MGLFGGSKSSSSVHNDNRQAAADAGGISAFDSRVNIRTADPEIVRAALNLARSQAVAGQKNINQFLQATTSVLRERNQQAAENVERALSAAAGRDVSAADGLVDVVKNLSLPLAMAIGVGGVYLWRRGKK